jgi:hypothetical protein
MAHFLVNQLRFTRSEWIRAFEGVSGEDALRRFEPMNCISWLIGHLAWHEQLYWLQRAQGKTLIPELENYGFGAPMSTPPLDEVWQSWHAVTQAADPYLDTLTTETLQTHYLVNGKPAQVNIGTNMLRVTYHYWYHLGEGQAIRQMLGHTNLPGFIGDIAKAPYEPH